MKYYAHINSKNVLTGIDMSTMITDEYGSEDVQNIEVDKTLYDNKQKYGIEYYIYQDGEIVENPDYKKEQAQKRQQEFLKDFFKVPLSSQFTEKEYAYYRKIPKGYSSAIESIMAAERVCSKMQGLPANNLIFYEEPDFYDETQCTEEWLYSHQITLPALTVEQFDNIFITFIQSWNTQEHSKSNEQENEKEEENEHI